MRLSCTYKDFAYVCVRLLRTLCGFLLCIRLFVRVERLFPTYTDFYAHWAAFDSLKFSMIRYWGFFDLLKVCANTRDDCTVWRIRSSGFRQVLYPKICTLWLYHVILSDWGSYPTIFSQFTVRSYLRGFLLILIEQYIYPGRVILLCTMLLCGSYNCRCEGY